MGERDAHANLHFAESGEHVAGPWKVVDVHFARTAFTIEGMDQVLGDQG